METSRAKRYPAVFALVAIIVGIVFADLIEPPLWLIFVSMLVSFGSALALYFRGETTGAGTAVLVSLMIVSAFVFSLKYETFPPKHIKHLVDTDRQYTLYCTIDDWPLLREHRTILYCRVDSVSSGRETRESMGRIMLTIGAETTLLQYGDRIYFDSRVYSIKSGMNPYGFDYRRYLNLKGIFAACFVPTQYSIWRDKRDRGHFLNLIDYIRDFINRTFSRSLDRTSAAVASGFLIGETRNIPAKIYDYFRDTGTLHLLAVSGSNVWLVVLVFLVLLRASPWSLTARTVFLLTVILFFSYLAYNQPSVVRASVMAALVLVGRASQRKIEYNNIVAAAGVIILLYDPAQLYDIGFQLSFATAWGLIFLTPKVAVLFRKIQNRWYYRYLILPAIVCIIAQLVALPISAYYFQRLPAVSFVSNLIIIPLVSVIVIGEVVLLFAALIHPLMGVFFGSLLNPLFSLTVWLLGVFSGGSFGFPLAIRFDGWMIAGYFVLLIGVILGISLKRARRYTIVLLLVIANTYMLSAVISGSKENRLIVFSTPGGIAALMDNSTPTVFLADIPRKDYVVTERTVLPYIKNDKLDSCRIVILGTDYQTVSEALYLVDATEAGSICLPYGARNIFTDNLRLMNRWGDPEDTSEIGAKPLFYDPVDPFDLDAAAANNVYLFDFGAALDFDSSLVILTRDISENLPEFINRNISKKDLILITDIFSGKDYGRLGGLEITGDFYIICRQKGRESQNLTAETDWPKKPPKFLQTSQLGAVKLIISDGRVSPDI